MEDRYPRVQSREIGIARAVVYRFLSQCFSHPDGELLELFRSAKLEEVIQSCHYLGLNTSEIVAIANNRLAARLNPQDALMELEKEYTRLFITAYPKVIAPPYSSVYLDKGRFVWGQSTAEVAKMYQAAGLDISKNFHDIPDHIAAELEFASYLIQEQIISGLHTRQANHELPSIENRFLEGHLFRWALTFFHQVSESSPTTFYGIIARLAAQFIAWDAQRLNKESQQNPSTQLNITPSVKEVQKKANSSVQ